MAGQEGPASWQPLLQSSAVGNQGHKVHANTQLKTSSSNALPSKREIFMSTLLTRLPTYALQLLAEGNEEKLACFARLSRDDLSAVLAQPQPQLLLEAIYQQLQQQKGSNQTLPHAVSSDLRSSSSELGDLEDSPFTRSMQKTASYSANSSACRVNSSTSSTVLTEDDLLPVGLRNNSSSSYSVPVPAGNTNLMACSSLMSCATSPVCSPLSAAVAQQSWPIACSNGSSRRYRFRGTPVCSNCGIMGHTADTCYTPRCNTCHLWGHQEDDCPNAQCWICGCYGHSFTNCPEQQQQPQQELSLTSSVNSLPAETSFLLSARDCRTFDSFTSCQSSPAAFATSVCSLMKSAAAADVRGVANGRATSSSRSSSRDVLHPLTPSASSPVNIPPTPGAAGSSSKAAPARDALLQPPPPPLPPAAAAARSSAVPAAARKPAAAGSSSSTTKARKYMFGSNGRGPLVCCKCGAMGHIGDKCHTVYCDECKRYGHSSGNCANACSKCGKEHNAPMGDQCAVKICGNCGLWGHRPRNCPSVQCANCGYYGHTAAQCMACPQCKKHGHTAVKCPVTKLLGVGMYEMMVNDDV